MVSSTVIIALVLQIILCLVAPVGLLIYMVFKKKQKSATHLVISGALATVVGAFIIGMILQLILSQIVDLNSLRENNNLVYLLLTELAVAIAFIIGIIFFIKFLQPGGLTVNRLIVFAAGVHLAYAILFVVMKAYEDITVMMYIKSGQIDGSAYADMYNSTSEFDTIMEGFHQMALCAIVGGVVLYIYKGIYKNEFVKYCAIAMCVYVAVTVIYILLLAIHSVVGLILGIIFEFAVAFGVSWYIYNNVVKENYKIKPISMQQEEI